MAVGVQYQNDSWKDLVSKIKQQSKIYSCYKTQTSKNTQKSNLKKQGFLKLKPKRGNKISKGLCVFCLSICQPFVRKPVEKFLTTEKWQELPHETVPCHCVGGVWRSMLQYRPITIHRWLVSTICENQILGKLAAQGILLAAPGILFNACPSNLSSSRLTAAARFRRNCSVPGHVQRRCALDGLLAPQGHYYRRPCNQPSYSCRSGIANCLAHTSCWIGRWLSCTVTLSWIFCTRVTLAR